MNPEIIIKIEVSPQRAQISSGESGKGDSAVPSLSVSSHQEISRDPTAAPVAVGPESVDAWDIPVPQLTDDSGLSAAADDDWAAPLPPDGDFVESAAVTGNYFVPPVPRSLDETGASDDNDNDWATPLPPDDEFEKAVAGDYPVPPAPRSSDGAGASDDDDWAAPRPPDDEFEKTVAVAGNYPVPPIPEV